MGQAAQTFVNGVADYAIVGKRSRKVLNSLDRYTGNLSVYKNARVSVGITPGQTGDTMCQLTPDVSVASVSTSSAPQSASSAGFATLFLRHSAIAAALFVVLATSVEASNVWHSPEDGESFHILPRAQLSRITAASEPAITDLQRGLSTSNPVATELVTARASTRDSLNSLKQLQARHASAQQHHDLLSQETLDLNEELLQLDWKSVALQSELDENPETRVVYNFVDVPIGARVDPSSGTVTIPESSSGANRYETSSYDSGPDAAYGSDYSQASSGSYDAQEESRGDQYTNFGTPFFN